MRGTVLSGTGGVWRVLADDGETYETALRGRLKLGGTKLAVGDAVELERGERGDGVAIAKIHERRSKLGRRVPGGGHGEREEAHQRPAEAEGGASHAREALVERCHPAGQDADDRHRDREVGERSHPAQQLLLVAEAAQHALVFSDGVAAALPVGG